LGLPAASKPDVATGWVGMSGGVVGKEAPGGTVHLFGAVQEVPANFTAGLLRVARLSDAFADQSFLAELSLALGEAPSRSDWPSSAPAPVSCFPSPLTEVVHLFDRREHAEYVGSIIGPGPMEIVLSGVDDDMLDLFVTRLEEHTLPLRDRHATRPGPVTTGLDARREVVRMEWPFTLPRADMRLRTVTSALRTRLAAASEGDDFGAALHARLNQSDSPAWVNLSISAPRFTDEDVVPLRAWRKLWHDARASGSLPPCGVIYTVSGVDGLLPAALDRALAPLGQEAPPQPLPLPECSAVMLRKWEAHLRDFQASEALQLAARALHPRFLHQTFRLRTLDRYLKTGIQ